MTPHFRTGTVAWPMLFAVAFCAVMALAGVTSRPLFPVDETRYVTVAWEMFAHKNWLLPTLNFEAYHHKPPLLFWIIMTLWSVFGVTQTAAMVAPYLISAAACVMTIHMTRLLAPENPRLPLMACSLMLGSIIFVIYGNLIMFDMLLSIFVTLGLCSIWQFARTGRGLYIVLLALAVGLGILAKGPVALLHLVFPILLVRWWLPADQAIVSRGKWIAAIAAAVLAGAAMALAWAIPAAIAGGPEFTEKIFWGQTAGRMANSFDHQRPFWWYLPLLPAFGLPWLLHGGLWKGFKALKQEPGQNAVIRFLLSWMIPVFVSFSLISGKQLHYLLPLIPGISILFALALDAVRDRITVLQALPSVMICAALALLPGAAGVFAQEIENLDRDNIHVAETLGQMSLPISLASFSLIVFMTLTQLRRGLLAQVSVIAVSMLVFVSCLLLEAGRGYFKNYDLAPIASIVQQFPDTPMAFIRNYHGEWGFLARREQPVQQIDLPDVPSWFAAHPNGLAFIRTQRPEEFAPYDVIYSQPYRMTGTYAMIVPKGKAKNFPYIVPEK